MELGAHRGTRGCSGELGAHRGPGDCTGELWAQPPLQGRRSRSQERVPIPEACRTTVPCTKELGLRTPCSREGRFARVIDEVRSSLASWTWSSKKNTKDCGQNISPSRVRFQNCDTQMQKRAVKDCSPVRQDHRALTRQVTPLGKPPPPSEMPPEATGKHRMG